MGLIAFLEDRKQQAGYLLSLANAHSVTHDQIVRTDDGWRVPTVISSAYTEVAALAYDQPVANGTSGPVNSFLWASLLTGSDVALGAHQTLDWDAGVSVIGTDLELDVDGQTFRVLTPGMYQVFFTPHIMPTDDADGVAQFFLDPAANGSPATIYPLESLNFPLRPSANAEPRGAAAHHMAAGLSGIIAGTYSWVPGVFEAADEFKLYASGSYAAGSAVLMGTWSSLTIVRLA